MLYTGKGDDGTTKLFGLPSGVRVSKSEEIFGLLGLLDMLNSFLGLIKTKSKKYSVKTIGKSLSYQSLVGDIQEKLFIIQAQVAGADKSVPPKTVQDCERVINEISARLPKITSFIVPGGSELSALFDVARTMARSTERKAVSFAKRNSAGKRGKKTIEPVTLQYLNRLSSLLYALARHANYIKRIKEGGPKYT